VSCRERVEVTAEDILNGRPRQVCGCPVALAICRALGVRPEDALLGVYPGEIRIWERLTLPSCRLAVPPEVSQFIRAFDSGEPVEPFAFDLDLSEALS